MAKRHRTNDTYEIIWSIVKQIPKGKVASYGEIAKLCDLYGHARQVGYAMHNLPPKSNIPWHRVINSAGKISLPKTGGHYRRQRTLLEKEGVRFVNDKIDFKKFGWMLALERKYR